MIVVVVILTVAVYVKNDVLLIMLEVLDNERLALDLDDDMHVDE